MDSIEKIKDIVREGLTGEPTAHDYPHVSRVLRNAILIAETEPKADILIVKAAALLHDFGYSRKPIIGEHGKYGADLAKPIMESLDFTPEQTKKVLFAIEFHNPFVHPPSPDFAIETNILRDADRLDGIGHVGIMRGVAYATNAGVDVLKALEEQLLYHFVTEKGKELAEPRTKIMIEYIENLRKDMQIR